ncbi:hypothetical protein LW135_04060 [Helicobacter sp. faydin-H20]|uniref:hypothetical protein n=1 Tax=Helicobacter anatolicus TaxID=2905874 RepID=UPI001E45CFD2|nr:hypothetical protein [Helicobacter anatolicus]MCE3037003.1 hypothetical protein [Helicobacter anatolicus]
MKKIFGILFFCLFYGCGSVYQIAPLQDFSFENGKKIIESNLKNSSVLLEIAQDNYNTITPLLLKVLAKSKNPILFDSNNITAYQEGKIFKVLDSHQILHSNINFTNSLRAFNIPIPPLPINYYYPNIFYSPFFGFGFGRNYGISDDYFREIEYSGSILFAHYLKKTTLKNNIFSGGFIAIVLQDAVEGKIYIKVQIGEEIHEVGFFLQSQQK